MAADMFDADLVIIGAGPAGLAAVREVIDAGARVVVLDEQAAPGGQIYRNVLGASERQNALLGQDYSDGHKLAASVIDGKADYRAGATVWQVGRDGTVHFTRDGAAGRIRGRHVLLATGALERPMPVSGWTLPGVMTAGAAQILMKTGALAANNAVLAGSGPLLYLVACQMIRAGFAPKALVETQPGSAWIAGLRHLPRALRGWKTLVKGLGLIAAIRKAGVPRYPGASQLQIEGENTAQAITFQHNGKRRRIATDTVLLHQGVIPNTQITRALGIDHQWDDLQRCFHPVHDEYGQSTIETISMAGDGAGIAGAKAAEYSGRIAAINVLAKLGLITEPEKRVRVRHWIGLRRSEQAVRPLLDTLYAPPREILQPVGETIVCRCEEVTAVDIRTYAALGCQGPNQLKAFSRCGMGPCQGRYCGPTVTNILAQELNTTPDRIGTFRVRSPIKPITLGELAKLDEAL